MPPLDLKNSSRLNGANLGSASFASLAAYADFEASTVLRTLTAERGPWGPTSASFRRSRIRSVVAPMLFGGTSKTSVPPYGLDSGSHHSGSKDARSSSPTTTPARAIVSPIDLAGAPE